LEPSGLFYELFKGISIDSSQSLAFPVVL
jgi:hypothetical protein